MTTLSTIVDSISRCNRVCETGVGMAKTQRFRAIPRAMPGAIPLRLPPLTRVRRSAQQVRRAQPQGKRRTGTLPATPHRRRDNRVRTFLPRLSPSPQVRRCAARPHQAGLELRVVHELRQSCVGGAAQRPVDFPDPEARRQGPCARPDLADDITPGGLFRTPPPRNVAVTSPYFRNAGFAALEDEARPALCARPTERSGTPSPPAGPGASTPLPRLRSRQCGAARTLAARQPARGGRPRIRSRSRGR
jgi:hypothetical protein